MTCRLLFRDSFFPECCLCWCVLHFPQNLGDTSACQHAYGHLQDFVRCRAVRMQGARGSPGPELVQVRRVPEKSLERICRTKFGSSGSTALAETGSKSTSYRLSANQVALGSSAEATRFIQTQPFFSYPRIGGLDWWFG